MVLMALSFWAGFVPVGLLIWLGLFFVMHVQYRKIYVQMYSAGSTQKSISEVLKWVLICVHTLILPVLLLMYLLLPSMLGTRKNAVDPDQKSYARKVYVAVMAAAVAGDKVSSDCTKGLESYGVQPNADLVSCAVNATDAANPKVTLTFSSGNYITLP